MAYLVAHWMASPWPKTRPIKTSVPLVTKIKVPYFPLLSYRTPRYVTLHYLPYVTYLTLLYVTYRRDFSSPSPQITEAIQRQSTLTHCATLAPNPLNLPTLYYDKYRYPYPLLPLLPTNFYLPPLSAHGVVTYRRYLSRHHLSARFARRCTFRPWMCCYPCPACIILPFGVMLAIWQ